MRTYVEELRRRFDRRYPLAYSAPYIRPEGRHMLWEAQKAAGLPDRFAVEVGSNQLMLAPWVGQFVEAAEFDSPDGGASKLRPDLDFPDVFLDPIHRGGEPTIAGRNVRVSTLAGLVRGGEDLVEVAEWYDLEVDQVRQAVGYDSVHPRIA
jgi:uncharacterized protein (DUF433 family)